MTDSIAIILAAGMGTRLGDYTKHLPKGMLPFAGKALIEHQVATLRKAGIHDISIVTGYEPSKIKIQGVKTYHNPEYQSTNMVASLFCAEEELKRGRPVLVCYADILYEVRLIKNLLAQHSDVCVLVDEDWIPYWQARNPQWQDDIESLQIDSKDKIIDIGESTKDLSKAAVRYIGLNLFNPKGLQRLLEMYHREKTIHWNSDHPWKRSRSFKKAYMTCMLQTLIQEGVDVAATKIRHGWLEFDTVDDYERAISWLNDGSISRFIDMSSIIH